MQKLKLHLTTTHSLKVLPLKPVVGQYTAVHATLTARDFFLANFYPSGLFTCIFSKTSPEFFLCLSVSLSALCISQSKCVCQSVCTVFITVKMCVCQSACTVFFTVKMCVSQSVCTVFITVKMSVSLSALCLSLSKYACLSACTVCITVKMFVCVCTRERACVCVRACVRAYVRTCVCVCAPTQKVCVRVRASVVRRQTWAWREVPAEKARGQIQLNRQGSEAVNQSVNKWVRQIETNCLWPHPTLVPSYRCGAPRSPPPTPTFSPPPPHDLQLSAV